MRLVCTRRPECLGHDLSLSFFIHSENSFVWAFRMVLLQQIHMPMELGRHSVFFW